MRITGLFTLFFSLASPLTAVGQDRQRAGEIEEVTVTAQLREQSLQDVPIAISAFSSDTLQEASVSTAQDLADLVPNLIVPSESPSGATNGIIFLRGIGTDNTQYTLDPAVGIYIDGVYLARSFGTLFDLFDIERVEVLRGPQGTLYGRNNSVGAVRVISRAPSLSDTDAAVRVGVGSFEERRGELRLSAPIIEDRLGASIAVTQRTNNGTQVNLFDTNDKGQSVDFTGLNTALLWRLTDDLDATLRYNYYLDEADSTQNVPIGDADPYTYEGDLQNRNRVVNAGTALTLEWSPSDTLQLTSISAFREVDLDVAFNIDGVGTEEFNIPFQKIEDDYFTQELYVQGDSDAGLNWVAGLFYFDENIDEDQSIVFGPDLLFPGSPRLPLDFLRNLQTESLAVYGQLSIPFGDRFVATAGARWTDDEKVFADRIADTRSEFSDDIVTWRAALDYRLSEDAMVYGSVATGYRAGGFDINTGDPFETEEAETIEIGTKLTLMDGRMRVNAAYFFSSYDNLQQSITSETSETGLATTAIDADIQGLELEVDAQLTDAFRLNAVVGTLSTDVDDAPSVDVKYSPDVTWRLSATYSASMGNGDASASLAYASTDSFFLDPDNVASRQIADTKNLTARIAYRTGDDRWEFSLAGLNLTEEDEPTFKFLLPFAGLSEPLTQFPRRPRRWEAIATYYF